MIARAWVALLGALLLGCGSRGTAPSRNCPPCRDRAFRDEAAAAKIVSQWKRLPPALSEIAGAAPPECLCFGTRPSVTIDGENAYLPSDWTPEEQAARAAHLALHRRRPSWNAEPGVSCEARVNGAMEREAEAHALELDVRRALGIHAARYPFEARYFATPAADRHAWLRAHFHAHPEDDGVVRGLVLEYKKRCRHP